MERSLDRFSIDQAMSCEQAFQQKVAVGPSMLVENQANKAVRSGLGDAIQDVTWQVGCKSSAGGCTVDAASTPDPSGDAEAIFDERLAQQRGKSWQSSCGQTVHIVLVAHQEGKMIALAMMASNPGLEP